MKNYSEKQTQCQIKNTWLQISFSDDITSELGNTIPYPHHHYMKHDKIVYCWLIDGFFDTLKGIQFLNDIIARFKITFETSQYLEHSVDSETTICPLKLKAFQNLKSRAIQRIQQTTRFDGTRDFIFYCLKLHAEIIIKEKGIFSYDDLEDFAISNFIEKAKDRSTLRAKCRNIFNWYLERNFELTKTVYVKKERELVMATRVQHANKLSMKNEEIAKQKIYNSQRLIKYFGNQDGKLSLRAIERDSGCSINTVRKHFISWDKI